MPKDQTEIAGYLAEMNGTKRGLVSTARRLVTSKNIALSTARLQPGSFSKPGGFTQVRTNDRERRISCTFPLANVATPFYHGLGFAPSGYTPLGNGGTGKVYNDIPLPSTSMVIVLKCDTANAVVDILVR